MRRFILLVVVTLVCHGQLFGQAKSQETSEVKRLFGEADKKLADGDPEGAIRSLDEAGKRPEQGANIEAKLKQGRIWLQSGANDRSQLEKALNAFTTVAEDRSAPAEKKTLAKINAAAVQMKMDKPQEAVRLLKTCDWTTVDKSQHYVLHYNLARAQDESGNEQAAFDGYRACLTLNPFHNQAALAASESA